jgi:serine/threonine protein phosphatase PrpC
VDVDVTTEAGLRCAVCGALGEPGDRFCEQCGARRDGSAAGGEVCQGCGAPPDAIGEDGYCTVCGFFRRLAHRAEVDLGMAAAVSDQGRVHHRNEDAFDLQVLSEHDAVVIVVCDGISSSSAADAAAQEAAAAAGARLARWVRDPEGDEGGAAIVEALASATRAVTAVPWTTRADRAVPSCTLVAGIVRGDEITVGWVGDSRAYWIDASGVEQLTVDDSWAEAVVSAGLLTAEQAANDPRAHTITHWVGPDAPPRPPQVVTRTPEQAGRLMLCTDGLWNYAPSNGEMSALVAALPPAAAPVAVARALTDTAVSRGGRDNITVAVVDVPGPGERPVSPEPPEEA